MSVFPSFSVFRRQRLICPAVRHQGQKDTRGPTRRSFLDVHSYSEDMYTKQQQDN